MPTTSDLLLRWDAQRPRTLQTDLGWSDIGGCRRRAGYRVNGVEPSNAPGSVQAVLGTAVHDAVESISRQLGYDAENEITFAGVKGHFDRVEVDTVVDVKTVGTDRWLEHIQLHSPPRGDVWQVHGYGAGLLVAGVKIRYVRIDYLARDTGREWSWGPVPFNPLEVKAALEWLRQVRDTELEDLPRDYMPESAFCRGCQFYRPCWGQAPPDRNPLSAIYVEDPNTRRWAQELFEVRRDIKALTETEERLKGILDGARPDIHNDDDRFLDVGDRVLEFRPGRVEGKFSLYFRAKDR